MKELRFLSIPSTAYALSEYFGLCQATFSSHTTTFTYYLLPTIRIQKSIPMPRLRKAIFHNYLHFVTIIVEK